MARVERHLLVFMPFETIVGVENSTRSWGCTQLYEDLPRVLDETLGLPILSPLLQMQGPDQCVCSYA